MVSSLLNFLVLQLFLYRETSLIRSFVYTEVYVTSLSREIDKQSWSGCSKLFVSVNRVTMLRESILC